MLDSTSKEIEAQTNQINDIQGKMKTVADRNTAEAKAKSDAREQSEESAQNFSAQMDTLQPGNVITTIEQGGTSVVNGIFNAFGMGR